MIPPFVHHPSATSLYSFLLPPGLHFCSLSDIEEALVTPFNTSTTRRAIADGLNRYVGDLEAHQVIGRIWVDGSFVTNKNHAGDVDVFSLVSFDLLNRLSQRNQDFAMQMLNAGEGTKKDYMVHSFFVVCPPPLHPVYAAQIASTKKWRDFFGHTRPLSMIGGHQVKLAKGMLSIPFGDATEISVVDDWLTNAL